MGIPPLEDGLYAILLMFDDFRVFEFLKVGRMRFLIRTNSLCVMTTDSLCVMTTKPP